MTAIGMLLSLHLCFLYYVDGNHRDLPSFPTRRSSDLARSAGSGARSQGTPATLPEKPLLRFYGGIARTATRVAETGGDKTPDTIRVTASSLLSRAEAGLGNSRFPFR